MHVAAHGKDKKFFFGTPGDPFVVAEKESQSINMYMYPQNGPGYEYILEAPKTLRKETIIHVHTHERTVPDLQPPTKVEQVAVM